MPVSGQAQLHSSSLLVLVNRSRTAPRLNPLSPVPSARSYEPPYFLQCTAPYPTSHASFSSSALLLYCPALLLVYFSVQRPHSGVPSTQPGFRLCLLRLPAQAKQIQSFPESRPSVKDGHTNAGGLRAKGCAVLKPLVKGAQETLRAFPASGNFQGRRLGPFEARDNCSQSRFRGAGTSSLNAETTYAIRICRTNPGSTNPRRNVGSEVACQLLRQGHERKARGRSSDKRAAHPAAFAPNAVILSPLNSHPVLLKPLVTFCGKPSSSFAIPSSCFAKALVLLPRHVC